MRYRITRTRHKLEDDSVVVEDPTKGLGRIEDVEAYDHDRVEILWSQSV